MKRLIVKPMPQANATPRTCSQLVPLGSCAQPAATARATKARIPTGLPITSPAVTPVVTGWVRSVSEIPANDIPAFANANIGRIA